MDRKKEIAKMVILIIVTFVLVGTGVFLFFGKNSSFKSLVSKKAPYPTYVNTIKEGKPWGTLKEPMQALTGKGKLFISDTGHSRVLAFDLKGKYLFQFEDKIKPSQRHLKFPYGLAVDYNGEIYVADLEAGKVFVFNNKGDFLREFNQDNKYIVKPAGICIWQDRVYISDIGFHRVYVFDKKGNLLQTIGSGPGKANDQFYYPNAVTVGIDGRIFVSDTMNNRIQIYNQQGKFIETYDGGSNHELINPRGLTIDSGNQLYICGTLNKSIKVFDKDGIYLFEIARSKKNLFSIPVDVFVDEFDNIYVTDKGSNQIVIYKK